MELDSFPSWELGPATRCPHAAPAAVVIIVSAVSLQLLIPFLSMFAMCSAQNPGVETIHPAVLFGLNCSGCHFWKQQHHILPGSFLRRLARRVSFPYPANESSWRRNLTNNQHIYVHKTYSHPSLNCMARLSIWCGVVVKEAVYCAGIPGQEQHYMTNASNIFWRCEGI